MGDHKDKHGTTKVGDFLRNIGHSELIDKAIKGGVKVLSGDYLGAVKSILSNSDELTPQDKAEALRLLELDYQDRDSARDMNKVTSKSDDKFVRRFLYYLASAIILFSFSLIVMMFFVEIPESNQRILDMCVGIVIGTGLVAVMNFFFGSSQGSKEKTDLFNKPHN